MRNLYVRIFVAFWIAMVLALVFTWITTMWLADQRAVREQSRPGSARARGLERTGRAWRTRIAGLAGR